MILCKNCNGPVARKSYIYCSNQCQLDYQYQKYIESWLSGVVDGGLSTGLVSKHIKRFFREKYNNSCQECSWSEVNPYTNKVPLEIEHVDGNHTNNKIDNLKILCPNCHSLTSTYKALNRGNGRKNRKLPQ